MKKEDRSFLEFLEDMINSIDKILKYIETVEGIEDFLSNDMVIDAVTRNYEIIGEAANKIPIEIKEKYPEVPWRQMYGLRNFAAHDYHKIDHRILWEIAEDHLVENRIMLEEILEKEINANK
ncbi:MAG TPA: HepT-like ribonuclease domain-containing protein [Cytophagales bacterium]|nr:HepT-like ribonuclease domain-containing protein [Cytophagales bacterium]